MTHRYRKRYRLPCPSLGCIGESAQLELVSHEFLTEDGGVQATTFADGTRVVMNLGPVRTRPIDRSGPGVSWKAS